MASFLKKGKQGTLSFKAAPKATAEPASDVSAPAVAPAPADAADTAPAAPPTPPQPVATAPFSAAVTLSQLGATAPTLEVWTAVAADTPRLPELTELLAADFAACWNSSSETTSLLR